MTLAWSVPLFRLLRRLEGVLAAQLIQKSNIQRQLGVGRGSARDGVSHAPAPVRLACHSNTGNVGGIERVAGVRLWIVVMVVATRKIGAAGEGGRLAIRREAACRLADGGRLCG